AREPRDFADDVRPLGMEGPEPVLQVPDAGRTGAFAVLEGAEVADVQTHRMELRVELLVRSPDITQAGRTGGTVEDRGLRHELHAGALEEHPAEVLPVV